MSKRLETEFAGVKFKNPVALASGTCGFGKEMNEYFDIQKLGGLCSKGLTLNPVAVMTESVSGRPQAAS